MKKQDVIDAVTYLMQDDKLRGISVALVKIVWKLLQQEVIS